MHREWTRKGGESDRRVLFCITASRRVLASTQRHLVWIFAESGLPSASGATTPPGRRRRTLLLFRAYTCSSTRTRTADTNRFSPTAPHYQHRAEAPPHAAEMYDTRSNHVQQPVKQGIETRYRLRIHRTYQLTGPLKTRASIEKKKKREYPINAFRFTLNRQLRDRQNRLPLTHPKGR